MGERSWLPLDFLFSAQLTILSLSVLGALDVETPSMFCIL